MRPFLFKVDEEQTGATGKDTNLSEKVPPSETSQSPGGEEKTVPVWSEKMSQSILAGLNFTIRVNLNLVKYSTIYYVK